MRATKEAPWGTVISPRERRGRELATFAALGGSTTAPTAALSGLFKGSHQSYVKDHLWNSRKRRSGFTATILLDTGAGGGNYASAKLIHAVQRHLFGGKNIVSTRGRGFLHAAIPAKDAVPPMSITGTALLLLIFPPVDRVFTVRVRVVRDLPFALIMGAAYLRHYSSVLDFKGSGSFRPSGDSARVPLLPPPERPRRAQPWRDRANRLEQDGLREEPSLVPGWSAAPYALRSGRVRDPTTGTFHYPMEEIFDTLEDNPTGDTFYSAEWRELRQQNADAPPSEVDMMAALDLGSTAWEDSATLKWPVYLEHKQVIPGRVSAEVGALIQGPRPFTSQLVVVFPLPPFDSEEDVAVGAAKGVQWWSPGEALKAKLTNHTTHTMTIDAGVQIATAYATNCDDVQRMLLLKEPAPPAITTEPPPRPPPAPEPSPEPADEGIQVSEINTGPLSPGARTTLLGAD